MSDSNKKVSNNHFETVTEAAFERSTLEKYPEVHKPKSKTRPAKVLDYDIIRTFAANGMKTKRIAQYFNCDEQLITDRCQDILITERIELEHRVRAKQLQCALDGKGNAQMLIHLGKVYLDQRDEIKLETPQGGIEWVVSTPSHIYKSRSLSADEKAELEEIRKEQESEHAAEPSDKSDERNVTA